MKFPTSKNCPPVRAEDWFDWGFWKDISAESFWTVQRMAVEDFKATGKHDLKPFEVFSRRYSHEMAHFIVCRDDQVFDPWWGLEVFTFREDGRGLFNDDECFTELEVLTVQGLINDYGPDRAAAFARTEMLTYTNLEGFGRWEKLTYDQKDELEDLLTAYARMFAAKWTRESLWQERHRKTDLVRARLGLPPEPRIG